MIISLQLLLVIAALCFHGAVSMSTSPCASGTDWNEYLPQLLSEAGIINFSPSHSFVQNLLGTRFNHEIVIPEFTEGLLGTDWTFNIKLKFRYLTSIDRMSARTVNVVSRTKLNLRGSIKMIKVTYNCLDEF